MEIPQANADDLNRAYAAAAQAQPAWAEALPGERAAVMRRAAAVIEARREEIVSLPADGRARRAGSTASQSASSA